MKHVLEKLVQTFPEFKDMATRIDENVDTLDDLKSFFSEEDDGYKENIGNVWSSLIDVLEIAEGIDDKEYCREKLKPIIEEVDKKLEKQVLEYKEKVKNLQNSLLSSLNEKNKIIKNRIENSKNIDLAEERLNQGIKINELLKETLSEMDKKN